MAQGTGGSPGLVRWEQGRAVVEAMLADGRLTRVQASRDLAAQYVQMARSRLAAVSRIQDEEPAGAFALTYDAARFALAAVLINQGLRPRGEGAHAVLLDVVLAQTEPPRQTHFREFSWMRRLRNDTQRFIHGALPAQHSSAYPQVRVAFESDTSSDNVA